MSRKSSARSTKTSERIDRPFAKDVLREARRIASGYRLTIQRSRSLGYTGSSIEMSGVMADGPTPEACFKATLESLTIAVATLLELGEQPPMPVDLSKRRAQINIRVTPDEKLRLEDAARERGFRNISEFLRTTALQAITAA